MWIFLWLLTQSTYHLKWLKEHETLSILFPVLALSSLLYFWKCFFLDSHIQSSTYFFLSFKIYNCFCSSILFEWLNQPKLGFISFSKWLDSGVNKTQYLILYQLMSVNIILYQLTSVNIILYQLTPVNIISYQMTPVNLKLYQLTSINIIFIISTDIYLL